MRFFFSCRRLFFFSSASVAGFKRLTFALSGPRLLIHDPLENRPSVLETLMARKSHYQTLRNGSATLVVSVSPQMPRCFYSSMALGELLFPITRSDVASIVVLAHLRQNQYILAPYVVKFIHFNSLFSRTGQVEMSTSNQSNNSISFLINQYRENRSRRFVCIFG